MLIISTPEKVTSNITNESKFTVLMENVVFYYSFPISWTMQSIMYQTIQSLIRSRRFTYSNYELSRPLLQIEFREADKIEDRLSSLLPDADIQRLLVLDKEISTKLQNIIKQNSITLQSQNALDLTTKLEDPIYKVTNESNFQITKNRLLELLQEEDEDDDGFLKPTPCAFDRAWNLLESVSEIMKEQFPKAWVSTDDRGGIRVTWSKLEVDAEVRLVCGATPESQTYIYHEQGSEYDIVRQVSVSSLAYWLKWLNQV